MGISQTERKARKVFYVRYFATSSAVQRPFYKGTETLQSSRSVITTTGVTESMVISGGSVTRRSYRHWSLNASRCVSEINRKWAAGQLMGSCTQVFPISIKVQVKGKDKVHPVTCHEGTKRG